MKRATIRIAGDTDTNYSLYEIPGKSLIAKKSVQLKRMPSNDAKTIYTAKPGETVGLVYSWVGGKGSPLWWQYYDNNGVAYYTLHEPGMYDVKVLKDQGAVTVKEQTEKEKKEKEAQTGGGGFKLPNFDLGLGDAGKIIGKVLIGVAVVGGAILAYNMSRPRYGVVRVRGIKRKGRKRK
jgi:hypothetical protein